MSDVHGLSASFVLIAKSPVMSNYGGRGSAVTELSTQQNVAHGHLELRNSCSRHL